MTGFNRGVPKETSIPHKSENGCRKRRGRILLITHEFRTSIPTFLREKKHQYYSVQLYRVTFTNIMLSLHTICIAALNNSKVHTDYKRIIESAIC